MCSTRRVLSPVTSTCCKHVSLRRNGSQLCVRGPRGNSETSPDPVIKALSSGSLTRLLRTNSPRHSEEEEHLAQQALLDSLKNLQQSVPERRLTPGEALRPSFDKDHGSNITEMDQNTENLHQSLTAIGISTGLCAQPANDMKRSTFTISSNSSSNRRPNWYSNGSSNCSSNSSSSEELPLQFGKYVVLKFLGKGAYGKVAKCTNSKTGEVVALKIFENGQGDMERELEILQHLKHFDPEEANLVRCVDHFTCGKYKCVAYQLLDRSLADLVVQQRRYFSLNELRPIAQQLLVAFNALKDAQVVHTDLKADNIMLVNHQEQPFKVKLIDFGCGYHKSELELGTTMQPEAYRAPEVTLAAPLSEAVDMWSLGCCLAEGFLGCELFSENSSYDHIRTIVHLLGQPSDEVLNRGFHSYKYFEQINGQWRFKSPLRFKATNQVTPKVVKMHLDHVPNLNEALMFGANQGEPDEHLDRLAFLDLLTNLLQTDPEKRLTPGEALRHPFITMDHLTQPSPYLQHAHDLMTFTLKTSSDKGEPENQSSYQNPQPPELQIENDFLGFGDQFFSHEVIHRTTYAISQTEEAKMISNEGFMNHFADKTCTVNPRRDKEPLSHVIEMDQKMDNLNPNTTSSTSIDESDTAEGPPEHVVFNMEDCPEDVFSESADRDERSASFRLTMKRAAFYGVVVFQAAACYLLTGSFMLSVLMLLPILLPNLNEALMFGASQREPDEHLDRMSFLDLLTNLLQTDPGKRLMPEEALRQPFSTVDHLTQPSLYLEHAHDLMNFTLKTSSDKGELENQSSSQNPQPPVPQTENNFLGFGYQFFSHEVIHRTIYAISQTEEAKISNEGFMNHFTDATFTVNPCRDEEPLSCVIEMDQIIENINPSTTSSTSIEELDMAEAPPEHVVINTEVCPGEVDMKRSTFTISSNRSSSSSSNRRPNWYSNGSSNCSSNSSSSEELPLQFGKYVVLKFLGEGAYGKVAKCTNSKTGEVVALKIFENDEGDIERELEILQHLKHIDPEEANLVRCVDHFTCGKYKCVAYHLLDCSLADLVVQQRRYFSLNELRPIAQQLLVAFDALKDAQVVHTDLKADNIMLVNHQEQPFKVKLIDFGCGYHKSELELGTTMQPEAYRAPEVTLAAPLSEAVDMWSLGCCLAEGFLGCELFSESSSYDHIRTIVHLLGQPSNEVLNRGFHSYKYFEQINGQWRFKSPLRFKATNQVTPKVVKMHLDHVPNLNEALMFGANQGEPDEHLDRLAFLDLLTNLLQTDPEKRLTPGEALQHPFITMDHLTQPSPYLQHAHDLMNFTLKTTSDKGEPENQSSHQNAQPPVPQTENDFLHRTTYAIPQTEEIKSSKGDLMNHFADTTCTVNPHRDEEPLCAIEMDNIIENLNPSTTSTTSIEELDTAEGPPEHVVINMEDCPEDVFSESADRDERSASFRLTMKRAAFYGVLAFQAAACYLLTGSFMLSILMVLPILFYRCRMLTVKMKSLVFNKPTDDRHTNDQQTPSQLHLQGALRATQHV